MELASAAPVLVPKDLVLAFFGIALSVIFSKEVFVGIVSFVIRFSSGVLPFKFPPVDNLANEETPEKIDRRHEIETYIQEQTGRIEKSISCNSAVGMTMLVIALTGFSFRSVGYTIRHFDVFLTMAICLLFLYFSYAGWVAVRERGYWNDLPLMARSRFNVLLSVEVILVAFYYSLVAREAFNPYLFLICGVTTIYISLRVFRIPQMIGTYRRANILSEREGFYLRGIGSETSIVSVVFALLLVFYLTCYGSLSTSMFAGYVDRHPFRSFSLCIAIPFLIFFWRFVAIVGPSALMKFVFFNAGLIELFRLRWRSAK